MTKAALHSIFHAYLHLVEVQRYQRNYPPAKGKARIMQCLTLPPCQTPGRAELDDRAWVRKSARAKGTGP